MLCAYLERTQTATSLPCAQRSVWLYLIEKGSSWYRFENNQRFAYTAATVPTLDQAPVKTERRNDLWLIDAEEDCCDSINGQLSLVNNSRQWYFMGPCD